MTEPTRHVPGWEGAIGPFRSEYALPHVYARDILDPSLLGPL